MMQQFTQELKNLTQDMIRDVHTVIPGKVVSFDPDKCEAVVLPFGKFKKPDGEMMDYPKISSVPVLFPQGAGQSATIVYPVKSDDYCLILVSEQALDTWRTGAASNTDLRFDLANAVTIVGLFSKPNPLVKEACDSGAIIVAKSGSRITLTDGDITLSTGGNINLTAGGSVNIRGATVNIN